MQTGVWSVFSNPSGLAISENLEIASGYGSEWLMKELSGRSVALSFKHGKNSFSGAGFRQFGYALFSESQGGIYHAKVLGKGVHSGVGIDYYSIAQGEDYGSAYTFFPVAGFQAELSKNAGFGFFVKNPRRASIGSIRTASVVAAGINWKFRKHAVLSFSADKYSDQPVLITAAFDLFASGKFALHTGVSNGVRPVYFGYSFSLGRITCSMQSGYHVLMGFSPAFHLKYSVKK